MSLDVKKQQVIAQTGSVQTGQINASNSAVTNNNSVVNGGELGAPVDTVNTNTSCENIQTRRTVDELYNAVSPLFKKYGISISKDEIISLLERVAGCKTEVILNLDNSEIQKQIQCLEVAINKLQKEDGSIDLQALGELANDYNIAIHTGWSIEGFEKEQRNGKESLKERLERVYPGKTFEEALELYFNSYFEKNIENALDKAKTPEEKEKIRVQETKRQLQDFGRLLANSSDDEKLLFRDAIKSLYTDNKIKGFEALMTSLDSQEARTELAEQPDTIEFLEQIPTTDQFGIKSGEKEVSAIAHMLVQNQSAEGRLEFHEKFVEKQEKFFSENAEVIKIINDKIKNNEPLTAEEEEIRKKITEFFQPVTKSEITGTASNLIITEDEKLNIIQLVNYDAYSISEKYDENFYKEVLSGVAEYAESLSEADQKAFVELMEKTIGENYTKVANGSTDNLTKPSLDNNGNNQVETPKLEEKVSTSSLGYETKEKQPDRTTDIERFYSENGISDTDISKQEETVGHNRDDKIKTIIEVAKGSTGDLTKYIKDNGTFKTLVDIYSNLNNITNKAVLSCAQKLYKMLNLNRQEDILKSIKSTSGFSELLAQTSDQVIMKLDTNFNSHYTNKQVEEAQEKARERILPAFVNKESCNNQSLMA